jgi:hypothetical protein
MDLLPGKLAHDLVELARGNREPSGFATTRVRAADGLQIRSSELEEPSFLPLTSSNALARIGIVLRFSTIDWIRPRPRWNSLLSIENFMADLPLDRRSSSSL